MPKGRRRGTTSDGGPGARGRGTLAGKELFLFDLDGVFYKGKESRVKLGGTKAVEALRERGRRLLVVTNNSTDSTETIWRRLAEFDIPVRREEVLTSGALTAEFLKEKHGEVTYFLVGEDGLEEEMSRLGHRRSDRDGTKFVVIGLDRKLTYEKLDRAARLARAGARLVATHSSRVYMSKDGPAMAPGPIVKALEFASGAKATIIGKPSPLMFKMALKRGSCSSGAAVMVGDQLETDYEGARRARIDFILVKTGVDRSAEGGGILAVLPSVDSLTRLL